MDATSASGGRTGRPKLVVANRPTVCPKGHKGSITLWGRRDWTSAPYPWGSETPIRAQISPVRSMWSLVYLLIRTIVALIIGTSKDGHDDGAKDLEILVLRHQLRVLSRTSGRPQFRTVDRVLLAAASRAIPRDRWAAFLVTPATLLRWHRELVRGRSVPGPDTGRIPGVPGGVAPHG